MFANAKRRSRARHVLAVGEIAAVGSLVPLLDRLPAMTDLLKGREDATWDFFGTVAAVGSGMYLAYRRCIPGEEVPAIEKAVARVLNEWDSQGYQAYLDFLGFVDRNIKGGLKPELAGRRLGGVEHQGFGAKQERRWASISTCGWSTAPSRFELRYGSPGGRCTASSERTRTTPATSVPF